MSILLKEGIKVKDQKNLREYLVGERKKLKDRGKIVYTNIFPQLESIKEVSWWLCKDAVKLLTKISSLTVVFDRSYDNMDELEVSLYVMFKDEQAEIKLDSRLVKFTSCEPLMIDKVMNRYITEMEGVADCAWYDPDADFWAIYIEFEPEEPGY